MMRQLVCSALLLSLMALGAADAAACECGGKGAPRQELRKAKAVFIGEVVEIKGGVNNEPYLVKFEVERHWKGVKGPSTTVLSPGGLCGISFGVGQRWLVYAYGDELWTDTCRRTTQVAHATEDLEALGKGKPPKPTTAGACTSKRSSPPTTAPSAERDKAGNVRRNATGGIKVKGETDRLIRWYRQSVGGKGIN